MQRNSQKVALATIKAFKKHATHLVSLPACNGVSPFPSLMQPAPPKMTPQEKTKATIATLRTAAWDPVPCWHQCQDIGGIMNVSKQHPELAQPDCPPSLAAVRACSMDHGTKDIQGCWEHESIMQHFKLSPAAPAVARAGRWSQMSAFPRRPIYSPANTLEVPNYQVIYSGSGPLFD